jgi:hypothetical protein
MMVKLSIVIAGLAAIIGIVAVAISNPVGADSDAVFDLAVDAAGNLHVPVDYRTTYNFLGSWAAANDSGTGSAELHTVYTSPNTIEAYRKDGQFPDGAVLVKEVYHAATEEMTTGTISHAAKLRGWFVMVRDRTGRHAESEVWGDGWGWAWFDAADPAKPSRFLPVKDNVPQPTFNYRENCQGCHAPAEATEWIYTEGYPPFRR